MKRFKVGSGGRRREALARASENFGFALALKVEKNYRGRARVRSAIVARAAPGVNRRKTFEARNGRRKLDGKGGSAMREHRRLTTDWNGNEDAGAVATRRRFLATCAVLAGAPLVGGCAVADIFLSSDPDADRIAANKATKDALKALEREASLHPDKKLVVCFIGVAGGGSAADLSAATRERLEQGNFRLVEKSAVQAALKASGVSPNNVFIPREREKFVSELGEDIDFLMAGYVERIVEEDEDGKKTRRTAYQLKLVNVATNRTFEFGGDDD